MPQLIVKQPNGKYAVFSTIVDNFTYYDLTPEELINHFCEEAAHDARIQAQRGIARADSEPHRFVDSLLRIERIHGLEERKTIVALIEGK